MRLKVSLFVVTCAIGAQALAAKDAQPDARIIAQTYDRCMATYAVRLTKTSASDDAIYAEAAKSCLPLKEKLTEAIRRQVSQQEAEMLLASMDASEKPNFVNMLDRIRSDRAKRENSYSNQ